MAHANNFDNSACLPDTIEDKTPDQTLRGRTIHVEAQDFPGAAPDLWHPQPHLQCWTTLAEYKCITDLDECRTKYINAMKNNNTWKTGCKYYVAGAVYSSTNVENNFYIVEMKPPYKAVKSNKWCVRKCRIKVAVRDKKGDERTTSYIEFAHTPLREVSDNHKQGLGKQLKEHAERLKIKQNDCRKGVNLGAMACTGTRYYNQQLLAYKTNTELMPVLMNCAESYFRKYGFVKWVNNLHRQQLACGASNKQIAGNSKKSQPWASLCVVSHNYANECHTDTKDSCQSITIWHEENIPRKGSDKIHIKHWYFLFPDLEVQVNGSWRTGVAIPLCHGTVVTWDARMIRHCTACPEIVMKKNDDKKPSSTAWGTYFGNTKNVQEKCAREKVQREKEQVDYNKK